MPSKNSPKKVIHLPRATKGVLNTLDNAIKQARENKWNRVIVIGEARDGNGGWRYSAMSDTQAVGMLEIAKKQILE